MSEPPEPSAQPTSRRAIRAAERAAERAQRAATQTSTGADQQTGADQAATTAPTKSVAPLTQSEPEPATPKEPEPKDVLAAEPAPSRAGRNLPWAITIGLLLGGVIVASLFVRKDAFLAVGVIGCALALWELDRALRTRDIRIPLLPLIVGAVGMLISAYSSGIEALLVAFLLTGGAAFIWRVLDGGGTAAMRDASAGIFAAAYIPFLAGFVMLLLAEDDGAWLVMMFITLVVANDVGGYVAGVFFGKHPMAPTVSPKKSWEGFTGSVLLAALAGFGFTHFVLDLPWWAGFGLGALTVVAATLGDLGESLLKRDLGVKDMGNLLPGHGGILDRMDSILIAAPVVFTAHLLLS